MRLMVWLAQRRPPCSRLGNRLIRTCLILTPDRDTEVFGPAIGAVD
jgi:hypothetical protein